MAWAAADTSGVAYEGIKPSRMPMTARASGGTTIATLPSWASGDVMLMPGCRQNTRMAATPATASAMAPNRVLAALAKAKTLSALFTSEMTSLTT